QAIELASVEHTRPAGFWVRCMAMGIDAALAAVLHAVVQAAIVGDGDVGGALTLTIIAVVCTLCIGRWGTTPGKALFELEVVSVTTSRRPTWSQTIRRELWLFGVVLAIGYATPLNHYFGEPLQYDIPGILVGVAIFTVMLNLMYAALRVPGKRAFWDR